MLLDDHEVVRLGLAALLSAQSDITVTGSCATSAALLAAMAVEAPDIVLIDLQLHGDTTSGLELIPLLIRRFPGCRVLVLSANDSPVTAATALQAGSAGYANKSEDIPELIRAIRAVARGRTYLPPSMAEEVAKLTSLSANAPEQSPEQSVMVAARLSPRELEVLLALLEGLSVNDVAARYGRSATTISTQKKNAFKKLGIRSNGDLFRIRHMLMPTN
nr:response regulator transcription factor [Stenotrophomonas rhizophila]